MKLRSLFFGTLCMLMLGVSFTSCSDDDDDSKKNDEGSKVELPENRVYILNMGSYQKNNAGITFYAPNKSLEMSLMTFSSNKTMPNWAMQDKI